MARIPKILFSSQDIDQPDDLKRLQMLIDHLPDEELMRKLEKMRGKGRNRYPVRAMWNALLARFIFQHPSIEALIRELRRNAQMREMCGFNIFKGADGAPTSSAFSRFMKKLKRLLPEQRELLDKCVELIGEALPDFGKEIVADTKVIQSFGKPCKNKKADGRRDTDADFGKKTYKGITKDGKEWKKEKSWFGYKLHLISDAKYELPISCMITGASVSDFKGAEMLLWRVPEFIQSNMEYFIADRGYDSQQLIDHLWQQRRVKPIIDIRNMWRDKKEDRLFCHHQNVTHNYCGQLYCYCPKVGERREMAFQGFEKDREALKFRCPAVQYGIHCQGRKSCSVRDSIRVPLSTDRRIFTPVSRTSYKWKKLYNKRSSIERINSRLDVSFGFERHTIRGKEKLEVHCLMAFGVMLGLALARIKENDLENLRSLVKTG